MEQSQVIGRISPVLLKCSAVVGVGIILALVPCPDGITQKAWYTLAIFVATILMFILQITSVGLVSFVALTLIAVLELAPISKVLSSFSGTTPWMIVCAFLLARGLRKTGLGRRVALIMVRMIGKSTLGLAYAMTFSEMFIGSAMPSITARSGGIMFPIANGLCEVYGSKPGESAKLIGSFLMQLGNQIACIVSAMFLTGMASNLIVVELAYTTTGNRVFWMDWFLAAIVPGLLSLLLIPILLIYLDKPTIRKTPEAKAMVTDQLRAMGRMTPQEYIMLGVFLSALFLWAFSGMNATTIAMGAIAILLCSKVLTWDDFISEKDGWDSFFWVAALMQMATLITEGGVLSWFVVSVSPVLENFSWKPTLFCIVLLYLYSQYFFASLSAHITALYAPLLIICIEAGAPPLLAALILAMFSNLCGGLTNYSAAHTPIWFTAGYTDQKIWWRNGLLCSILNFVTFLGAGSIWWKILKMY